MKIYLFGIFMVEFPVKVIEYHLPKQNLKHFMKMQNFICFPNLRGMKALKLLKTMQVLKLAMYCILKKMRTQIVKTKFN